MEFDLTVEKMVKKKKEKKTDWMSDKTNKHKKQLRKVVLTIWQLVMGHVVKASIHSYDILFQSPSCSQ